MKIRLEEILGEFVRCEGAEECHSCLSCGSRDGLYVNWVKGVWHCWGCNRGGSTGAREDSSTEVVIPPGSHAVIQELKDVSYKTAWGEVSIELDRAKRKAELYSLLWLRNYDADKVALHNWVNLYYAAAGAKRPLLAQKLYLKGIHCGWQFVSPEPIDGKKALISGRRGLGIGTRAESFSTKVAIIVEGLWDLLAIREALLAVMQETHLVQIFSLCGNTLSSDQLSELVRRARGVPKMVYVALDNDQPEKSAQVWNLLRVHMPCRIAEPPVEWGKDWDEAWQDHHDEALAFWAKRFVYRAR